MMKKILSIAVTLCLLTSCGMQKFTIGDTSGEKVNSDHRKMFHILEVIPIGRKQSFPINADAKGYEIITRYNLFDCLVTGLTVGIVNMKTVKFKSYK